MGSFFIVPSAEHFEQKPLLRSGPKSFEVEAFVAKLAVEALVRSVLSGFPGSDERSLDTIAV
ncbi:MAG: hypothetical protein ACJAYU_003126 [Bradymonadia bacterium]|jgi:hypothetical protein